MQARKILSGGLATLILISLFFAPAVFSESKLTEQQFERHMQLALRMWYDQHSETVTPTVTAANGNGAIEGVVKSGDSAIENAMVFGWTVVSDGLVTQTAKTDANGAYKLEGLVAGEYYVVASAEGYAPQFYGDGSTPVNAKMVEVVEDEVTSDINFNLRELENGKGAITGTVSAEAGGPIEGAWVVAVGRGNPFMHQNHFAVTDDQGNYSIAGLGKGIYIVATYANGYVPEIYDDATSIFDASPVMVNNETVTGIDFVLATGGSIAGNVSNSSGEPLENVKVVAHSTDNSKGIPGLDHFLQMDITDSQGNYKIDGLQEGEYKVSASFLNTSFGDRKYWNDQPDPSKADIVSVGQDEDVTGIDFTFTEPTAKISGVVMDGDGNPLKGVYVTYVLEDGHYQNFGRLWRHAVTNENGAYELANLKAGTYYVSAWFYDRQHFKGIWYDNKEEFENADPIELAEDQHVTDINFTLDISTDYGAIAGTVVSDEDGSPVSYALVQAVPVHSNRWGWAGRNHSAFLSYTDENGNYELSPLFKGDYHVIVRKNGYMEYYDDKTEEEQADAVTVVTGDTTKGIDFAIPDLPAEGSVVSGVVIDEKTGEPIAGALVTVFPAKRPRWFVGPARKWTRVYYASFSDKNGEYKIGGIPEGTYLAAGWAHGYIAEFFQDTRNPFKATPLELDGSNSISDVNFDLIPFTSNNGVFSATISGVVQGDDGSSVENAMVYAMNANGDIVGSEVTGPDGNYAMNGLEDGDYKIMVTRPSFGTTYYPNADSEESAEAVTVNTTTSNEVNNVNVTLSSDLTTDTTSEKIGAPTEYTLSQNYPNPFNPTTLIEYRVPESAHITLQIFNIQGQLIKTLVDEQQQANVHNVEWNGTDLNGEVVPSGVYFYQIQANDFTDIKSLVFMK